MGIDIVNRTDKTSCFIGENKVAFTLAYLFRNNIFTREKLAIRGVCVCVCLQEFLTPRNFWC